MTAYLVDLALRLAEGIALLPDDAIDRHANFLLGLQRGDGGFAGREGDSDPYYTSFALRAIALLGRLDDDVAERAVTYVDSQLDHVDGSVDFISTVFSAAQLEAATGIDLVGRRDEDWKGRVVGAWRELERNDGGYAKTPQSGSGSTYHTFLVVLASQLLDLPLRDSAQIAEFAKSRQRGDGGFVEIAAMRRSGTNPTAAAIAMLKIFDEPNDEVRKTAGAFLCDMQSQEGGLTANTRIPVADLLSTFTGLLTITDIASNLSGSLQVNLASIKRYVNALERQEGGFVGGVWDTDVDVEYTFYGLASLALLAVADA